ncbi:MAG TPA: xanthine dehydrogenase family protein subunit M [Candidatus Dormibacteraeota bacterium]|nr:xanthine dehydrogenase family protein subunit M [Candidatus Dormibacteraeota bacterium]
MIPAAFEYRRAGSVEDAVAILAEAGDDAKLLAGGHSLLPLMKLRLARPSVLVDIGRIDGLRAIEERGGRLAIGALARHHDLATSALLRDRCPLLAHAAGLVGDPQVRHRGTLGGSVVHADPASDLCAVLRCLDAELVVRGPGGERRLPVADAFRGFLETALDPGEVLVEVLVPMPAAGHGWSYQKFTRRALDWAIVGVAAVVEPADGGIGRAAVGLVSMGPTPLRAAAVEDALRGAPRSAVPAAAELAADGTEPSADIHAEQDFRRHLSRVLTRRALEQALSRC